MKKPGVHVNPPNEELDALSTISTSNLSKANQVRVELIAKIFDLLLESMPMYQTTKGYWYGDKFDELYDKEVSELRLYLEVYKNSRNKRYI